VNILSVKAMARLTLARSHDISSMRRPGLIRRSVPRSMRTGKANMAKRFAIATTRPRKPLHEANAIVQSTSKRHEPTGPEPGYYEPKPSRKHPDDFGSLNGNGGSL